MTARRLPYRPRPPFARKVLEAAHEPGLADRIEVLHHETGPTRRKDAVRWEIERRPEALRYPALADGQAAKLHAAHAWTETEAGLDEADASVPPRPSTNCGLAGPVRRAPVDARDPAVPGDPRLRPRHAGVGPRRLHWPYWFATDRCRNSKV